MAGRSRDCSTKLPPPKLKQKPNQSLRYETAREVRKTLTSDMQDRSSPVFVNEEIEPARSDDD